MGLITIAGTILGAIVIPNIPAIAQQTSTQDGFIGDNSNGNNLNQPNNQNLNNINIPNIYPLNTTIHTPVNTENDLGLNLSVGVNTLDPRNVTLYLGVIYQPGRTEDHQARMARLRSETQLIESQKQVAQSQLDLLRKQLIETELRIQQLQSTTTPKN